MSDTPKLRIIFDGPPAHESGRFVEVEDEAGVGVRVGEWVADKEPYWALVIDDPRALRSRIATLEAQVEQAREALGLSIKRCQWRGRVDETCSYPFGQIPHCNADAPCWLWGALQALREGGKNG